MSYCVYMHPLWSDTHCRRFSCYCHIRVFLQSGIRPSIGTRIQWIGQPAPDIACDLRKPQICRALKIKKKENQHDIPSSGRDGSCMTQAIKSTSIGTCRVATGAWRSQRKSMRRFLLGVLSSSVLVEVAATTIASLAKRGKKRASNRRLISLSAIVDYTAMEDFK